MTSQGILSWPMTRAVALRPNNEAIVDGETRLTYAQWGRRVRGLTGGLRNLGLHTGDVVAVIGQNSFRHLECWVGIPAAGMVLNDLNYRLAAAGLGLIRDAARARPPGARIHRQRLRRPSPRRRWRVPGGAPRAEPTLPLARCPGLLRGPVASGR